jgi:hypothetical protein
MKTAEQMQTLSLDFLIKHAIIESTTNIEMIVAFAPYS